MSRWARRAGKRSAWCCANRLAGADGHRQFGLSAAALATQFLEGMLYGVRPLNPVSFAGGALLLGGLAVVAGVIPARRAASVNPVEALSE